MMSWGSESFVIVVLFVIIGRVNNVRGKYIRIIIDNIEKCIGIAPEKDMKPASIREWT